MYAYGWFTKITEVLPPKKNMEPENKSLQKGKILLEISISRFDLIFRAESAS